MDKQYYYLDGQIKMGPISLDLLKGAPITGSTLVWHDSLTDWTEAYKLPELSSLFATQAPPVTPPPPSYTKAAPPPPSSTQAANPTTTHIPPPMPDNYLVWALLSTFFCCLPFGIASIVFSTKVNNLYLTGDYEAAEKASADTKKWAIIAAIAGATFWILYVIFFVVIMLMAAKDISY